MVLEKKLSVFGDYDTPDGSCIRDYIHVVDLAKAHVVANGAYVARQAKKQNPETFNVGTGVGLSVLEIVQKFQDVNNVSLNYQIVGRRAGDIEKVWADATIANNELGWKATKSVEEIVQSAWKLELQLQKKEKPTSNAC